jgi:hypothetical protein
VIWHFNENIIKKNQKECLKFIYLIETTATTMKHQFKPDRSFKNTLLKIAILIAMNGSTQETTQAIIDSGAS